MRNKSINEEAMFTSLPKIIGHFKVAAAKSSGEYKEFLEITAEGFENIQKLNIEGLNQTALKECEVILNSFTQAIDEQKKIEKINGTRDYSKCFEEASKIFNTTKQKIAEQRNSAFTQTQENLQKDFDALNNF